MSKHILWVSAVFVALGGCDEALLDANERAIDDEQLVDDERAIDDPGRTPPGEQEADEFTSPSAKDPCSDQYINHSAAFHACGTCPEGRVVDIMQQVCFGSGAWCPEECGPWEPYPYGPNCTPCD